MSRCLIALFGAATALYGNSVLVNDPTSLGTSSYYSWSQLGGDQSPVGQVFVWWPTPNQYIDGTLQNGPGTVEQACNSCAWQPNSSFAPGDSLLFTGSYASDSSSLTLSVSPNFGLGAYFQQGTLAAGTSGLQFSIGIQAYEGSNSVLNAIVTSDSTGDPIFVGIADTSAAITQVTYNLTDASGNPVAGDFALDGLMIANQANSQNSDSATPEPSAAFLAGSGLLLALWGRKMLARRA